MKRCKPCWQGRALNKANAWACHVAFGMSTLQVHCSGALEHVSRQSVEQKFKRDACITVMLNKQLELCLLETDIGMLHSFTHGFNLTEIEE